MSEPMSFHTDDQAQHSVDHVDAVEQVEPPAKPVKKPAAKPPTGYQPYALGL